AARSGPPPRRPTIVVCGASIGAGETHAAASIVRGLASAGLRVGAARLTGVASGRHGWQMLDAGAFEVYDVSDFGFPSTYGCALEELLAIHASAAATEATTHRQASASRDPRERGRDAGRGRRRLCRLRDRGRDLAARDGRPAARTDLHRG